MPFFHSLYLSFSVFCGQLSTKFIIARSLAHSQANCHRFVTFLSYLSKFIVDNLTAYYHKKNFKTKLFVDKLCPLTYCYTNCRFARAFSLIVKRIEKQKNSAKYAEFFMLDLNSWRNDIACRCWIERHFEKSRASACGRCGMAWRNNRIAIRRHKHINNCRHSDNHL